jgi:hypothetical protein
MITLTWADVGHIQEAGEQEVAGITVAVGWEHIAKWKEDPEGVWEVERGGPTVSGLRQFYTLDHWHPSKKKI